MQDDYDTLEERHDEDAMATFRSGKKSNGRWHSTKDEEGGARTAFPKRQTSSWYSFQCALYDKIQNELV